MRKVLKPLLILLAVCFPVSAQAQMACNDLAGTKLCPPALKPTRENCQAQLRNFEPPQWSTAYSLKSGRIHKVRIPDRLLFSQDGIEVYANIYPSNPYNGMPFLDQITDNGVEVLVVYQDEAARQAMIHSLRENHALLPSGMGALPDNLKYAMIQFEPKWLPSDLTPGNKFGNPFERDWEISYVEYDQPESCMDVFQNDDHRDFYDGGNHYVGEIAQTNPTINQRIPIDKYPFWSKAFQAMLAWTKECVSLLDP